MRKFILIIVLLSSLWTLVVGVINIDVYLIIASVVSIALILTLFDHEAKLKHLYTEMNAIEKRMRKRIKAILNSNYQEDAKS